MSSEVKILDSALLPKVQFNTERVCVCVGVGARRLPFFFVISSSLILVAVNYKETPLSGL